MEPSQSETFSDELAASISVEELAELRNNLNWHAAILAVLLEEAGGAVEVTAADLEGINVLTAQVQITRQDDNTYLIERVVNES